MFKKEKIPASFSQYYIQAYSIPNQFSQKLKLTNQKRCTACTRQFVLSLFLFPWVFFKIQYCRSSCYYLIQIQNIIKNKSQPRFSSSKSVSSEQLFQIFDLLAQKSYRREFHLFFHALQFPLFDDLLYRLIIINNLSKTNIEMDQSKPLSHPLLSPITLEILEQIQYSDIVVEARAKIQEHGNVFYEIVLVEDMIMLYSDEGHKAVPLSFMRLNFLLKFEKIIRTKNFSERQTTGFTFFHESKESISFHIASTEKAAEWCKQLSKQINETGFHKNFKPIRALGRGAFASVYEIARLDDGARFASKVFSSEHLRKNRLAMKCFLNQVEVMRLLEHKNILKIQGVYQSQNSLYVITEALHGGSLFENLQKRKSNLPTTTIQHIMYNLLEGLTHLQQSGIVHRDIKLQNIILRERHRNDPVIIDFGLAVFQEDENQNLQQCGTPGYLSPEIINFKKGLKLTSKCDVFSLGVVLHVLLTGRYLFNGATITQVLKDNIEMNFDLNSKMYQNLDASLMELLRRMLQKDPSKRPLASECLKDISHWNERQSQLADSNSQRSTTFDYQN